MVAGRRRRILEVVAVRRLRGDEHGHQVRVALADLDRALADFGAAERHLHHPQALRAIEQRKPEPLTAAALR